MSIPQSTKTGTHLPDSPAQPACDADAAWNVAREWIASRENVSPKRLVAPAPSPQQIEALMTLAAAAPDHGLLTPWRFVIVPVEKRHRLADAFALALADRDPDATPEQIEAARSKAHRAPLLIVAIACLGPRELDIGPLERMLSMGAAVQNILLGAHALGFGAGLTSGRALASPRMVPLLGLVEGETAVCCINIGTVSRRGRSGRSRPDPATFVRTL